MTYDIHHENCYYLKYNNEVNHLNNIYDAYKTWTNCGYNYGRLHISSPKNGYDDSASKARSHSDYIDIKSYQSLFNKIEEYFPTLHIDVETKYKEVSIKLLQESLSRDK
jgi:UV DNA damage repair endonuclease